MLGFKLPAGALLEVPPAWQAPSVQLVALWRRTTGLSIRGYLTLVPSFKITACLRVQLLFLEIQGLTVAAHVRPGSTPIGWPSRVR